MDGQSDSHSDRGARILIVEDEIVLAKDMARILKAAGYAVVGTVASGKEAVQIAEQTSPDLVLMDIKLRAEMDGIEAARQIRERMDTAIVYLTGFSERSDLFDRAKHTEPLAYLSKPISHFELLRTVETAMYRHWMAKELKESRGLLNLVINSLPVGVVYVNAQGVFQFSNETYKRWWGLSPEDGADRTVEEVMGADQYRGTIQAHIEKALAGEKVDYETTVLFTDGIKRQVTANYLPHGGDDGAFRGFVGLITDVTQSRKVEEDLRTHQIELETQNEDLRRAHAELESVKNNYMDLYDFAPTGYVTVSDTGLVLEANLTACRLLGLERSSFINRPFSRCICPDSQDAYYVFCRRLFETQSEATCEIQLQPKLGTELCCQLEGVPVYDPDGRLRGSRVIISDISHLKRAEEALRQANEELTKRLGEKEVLLREIHHRVKNNLAVVNSLLSLQSGFAADEVHRRMFEETQDRIRSMALAHELLYQSEHLSDIRSGEYLGKLVDHLIASACNIGQVVHVRKEIEDVPLALDTAIPVGFLVTELVSNCLKHAFTPGREGEMSISLRRVDDDESELVVKDNGVGLPAGIDLKHPNSLGLDLVGTFVSQLGGEIHFRGDQGTEIHVRFRNAKKTHHRDTEGTEKRREDSPQRRGEHSQEMR